MIKLAISGCLGRMGQTITNLALQDALTFQITTLLEHPDHPRAHEIIHNKPITTSSDDLADSDVLIDFTLPNGTMTNLKACLEHKVKMVIGTTGFASGEIEKIKDASRHIPIVFASNMSIGVNVLFKLIEIAGNKLDPIKIKISETHHIHKKDKPSGTAKTMVEIAEAASNHKIAHVDSLREGEVIGDHTIIFETGEDILSISHHAKDRSMFAKGALEAAKFLKNKDKGLFNMQDVLGLN